MHLEMKLHVTQVGNFDSDFKKQAVVVSCSILFLLSLYIRVRLLLN